MRHRSFVFNSINWNIVNVGGNDFCSCFVIFIILCLISVEPEVAYLARFGTNAACQKKLHTL